MADEHGHHRVHYLLIFIVLCIFTGLSVLCDVADMKGKEILGLNGTILLAFLVLAVAWHGDDAFHGHDSRSRGVGHSHTHDR